MDVVITHWTGRESRALRESKRMTLREFAALLGVDERNVSKWEGGDGECSPRPEMQAALDTVLARCTLEERDRFLATIGTTAPMLGRVPVEFEVRLAAGAEIEIHDDPLSVTIRSGAYRLAILPVPSRWDGHLSTDDIALVAKLADALTTMRTKLHTFAIAQRRRRGVGLGRLNGLG